MRTTPWADRFGYGLLLWLAVAATVFAQPAPAVFYASGSVTVSAGQSAGFYVHANGKPTPTFQWQHLPAGSVTWANLSEVGIFSGTGTDNLVIAVTAAVMNGDQFRCVATNASGPDISSAMTLTVTSPGRIPPEKRRVSRNFAPSVSVNRTPGSATGKQAIVVQSVAPPPAPMRSSSTGSSRVVVKLRNSAAQSLALALSSTTGAVKMASVPAIDRNLASLLSNHSVRAASPLFARVVRAKRQQGRSEAQLKTAMRQRFPARSARAPVSATPPISPVLMFSNLASVRPRK